MLTSFSINSYFSNKSSKPCNSCVFNCVKFNITSFYLVKIVLSRLFFFFRSHLISLRLFHLRFFICSLRFTIVTTFVNSISSNFRHMTHFTFSTFFHLVTISFDSVSLIDSGFRRSVWIVLLLVSKDRLHHHFILLLLFLIFEISPFCKNLHSINILNCS